MINTKFRKRRQVEAQPQQLSMTALDRQFNGEMRLVHELFRRGGRTDPFDGVTMPDLRKARLRELVLPYADERCMSKPEFTLRQVFESMYQEAL